LISTRLRVTSSILRRQISVDKQKLHDQGKGWDCAE
jgi:hypothetical protein